MQIRHICVICVPYYHLRSLFFTTFTKKNMTDFLHKELTELIIKAFYNVYNKLGYGFLEKVYENALAIELTEMGIEFEKQYPIQVYYKEHKVGFYVADLVVANAVIVELKAAERLCPDNEYQLLNYLRATDKEVGLLLNFGKKPQFKRLLMTNDRK